LGIALSVLRYWRRPTPALVTLGFIAMALVPLRGDAELTSYFLTLLDVMLVTFSLNMVVGLIGYLDFGHVVFWGLGAYAAGVAVASFSGPLSFSPYVFVPLSGLVAAAFAALVGYPALRIRGAYFAIASFSINLAVQTVFFNVEAFGGSEGLPLIRFISYQVVTAYYWELGFAFLGFVSTYLILKRKLGYGLLAIRNDEDVAKSLAINTTAYKVLIYTIGAFFAGVAGGVWGLAQVFVDPDNFGITRSIEMFVTMMLGGVGTASGPFLGAFIFYGLKDLLILRYPHAHLVIFGLIIMVIVLFLPGGIIGTLRERLPRLRRILE
jgi:branched-chain amino acid transport system permease protein